MENQVFSIEQMQELKELGIDTSKASMCWVETVYNRNLVIPNNEDCVNSISNYYSVKCPESIPTFTLQDILEMLPNTIEWKGKTYWFSVYINGLGNKIIGYRDSDLWPINLKPLTIDGAFLILKWCKQNNFLSIPSKANS